MTSDDRPVILLAEDDQELRSFLAERLRAADYEVVEVPDGIAAMQFISDTFSAAKPEPSPDLLITDIRMPRAEGVDVLAYTRLWQLPTIIVTAFGSEETYEEARQLGAVACFDKPFDIDVLLSTVANVLEDRAAASQHTEA